MAGTTGLEPATSAVTGQRSNQLSYVPQLFFDNFTMSHRIRGLSAFAILPCSPIACFGDTIPGLLIGKNGLQTEHQNHQPNNKIKFIR
jgi:hypothetical protein